jgi:protein-disulfide isomerase
MSAALRRALTAVQPALNPHHLQAYAHRLELDMDRFSTEMSDTVYLQRIREHQEGGAKSGVRATPAFFINGKLHDVSFGIAGLYDAIERVA